jgi:serine protease
MNRAGVTMAALVALITATATAQAQQSAPAASLDRAVVLVDTPDLPDGHTPATRTRWHELRSASTGILDRVANSDGLDVETAIPEIGMLSVDLGPGGLPALRRSLARDPRVESVRPDVPVQLRYSPNDTAFTQHDAHAPNGDLGQWNLIKEGAPRAWDLSRGVGAEVAVVDSGADGSHRDIASRIVGAQSFGTSTSPTTDTDGHGTHTAGLACGDGDNGYGIASIGFDCGLFIAKEGGLCSHVASAVTGAANRNADVISMSLGDCNSALVSALNYAQSRGSVLVAAGSNEPDPSGACLLPSLSSDCIYPEEWLQPNGTGPNADFDRGLVVTSAKYDGTRSSFAEQTSRISVAAFGSASDSGGGQQGILSTWPANTTDLDTGIPGEFGPCGCRTTVSGDSRFAYLVGTSMATPQVAGVAALIRAVKPNMANTKVVHLIKATASHCGSYRDGIGWGVIHADDAVAAALDRDVGAPTSKIKKARRTDGVVALKIKRHDTSGSTSCVKLPTAGVKKVLVFASANGGSYHRIGKTSRPKLRFHGKRGRRYRFYSVAVDDAGNREAPPARADAKVK